MGMGLRLAALLAAGAPLLTYSGNLILTRNADNFEIHQISFTKTSQYPLTGFKKFLMS